MIAKAKSISHGGAGIDYALKKDNAQIIDKRYMVGDNGQEIKKEFGIFQKLNTRATNKDLSFVLSPEPKDGQKLSNNDFKEISEDFLKKMGLDKHQAIIVKHTDRKHAHLHLFVNRIDTNGKAYNDSFVSKESQTQADNIAQERNLTRARVVQAYNQKTTKDLRAEIYNKHKAVMQHKPKTLGAYKELMKSSGVKVIPTINKQNKVQGFRVDFQDHNFKASAVNRNMTIPKIQAQLAEKKEQKRNLNQSKGLSI